MLTKKEMQEIIDLLSYEIDSWRESYEVCFNELEDTKDKLYQVKRKLKKLLKKL